MPAQAGAWGRKTHPSSGAWVQFTTECPEWKGVSRSSASSGTWNVL